MLSKAEILYLQGQKQVSQSYERKLKCLIRKKLDVLQIELPLLSKLFNWQKDSVIHCLNQVREPGPILTPMT